MAATKQMRKGKTRIFDNELFGFPFAHLWLFCSQVSFLTLVALPASLLKPVHLSKKLFPFPVLSSS
jgi:hypothetical protein